MMYCPRCQRLCNEEKCPQCGKSKGLRLPKANDPVLLLAADYRQSLMVEPVLEESGIPYSRSDAMGWGLSLRMGSLLETISYFVPYSAYGACREQLEETFDSAGDILLALHENDPQGE